MGAYENVLSRGEGPGTCKVFEGLKYVLCKITQDPVIIRTTPFQRCIAGL